MRYALWAADAVIALTVLIAYSRNRTTSRPCRRLGGAAGPAALGSADRKASLERIKRELILVPVRRA
ncbi:MAG: hypothetical protein ACREJM_09920, partial [Candidatus Saccharimonadales bacterium]